MIRKSQMIKILKYMWTAGPLNGFPWVFLFPSGRVMALAYWAGVILMYEFELKEEDGDDK